jgi:hypothetical protein
MQINLELAKWCNSYSMFHSGTHELHSICEFPFYHTVRSAHALIERTLCIVFIQSSNKSFTPHKQNHVGNFLQIEFLYTRYSLSQFL